MDQCGFLVWLWGGQRYGVPISSMERVVQMVELTAMPDAPPGTLGVINVEGQLTPVLGLGQSPPTTEPVDQKLILARSSTRMLALAAETIVGLVEAKEGDLVPAGQFSPETEKFESLLKTPEGVVLVPNLEKLTPPFTPKQD